MRVLAAPDKFKGTASAAAVAASIGHACWELGFDCVEIPMADGGDGLIEVLGGANRHSTVTGPLGDPVQAGWRFVGDTAVIEMARASGLELVGGFDFANRTVGGAVCSAGLEASIAGDVGQLAGHGKHQGRGLGMMGPGGRLEAAGRVVMHGPMVLDFSAPANAHGRAFVGDAWCGEVFGTLAPTTRAEEA